MNGLLVRYGEISLKKGNRRMFENTLAQNLRGFVKREGYPDCKVTRLHARYFLHGSYFDDETLELLTVFPGVTSISPVRYIDMLEPEDLILACMKYIKERVPFTKKGERMRVRIKRANKKFQVTSMEFAVQVAERMFMTFPEREFQVDLSNPELTFEVDIRDEGIFLFHQRLRGSSGLPIGTGGQVLSLLSGGIDSPTASWLMMSRGCHVDYLSFHSPPYIGEESVEKLQKIVRRLSRVQGRCRLYIIPFTKIQEAIRDNVPDPWRTIFYRRCMFFCGNIVAREEQHQAFVTGESLGQVASQTMENMTCIEDAAEFPVLRPLVALDKDWITDQAKRIGTYQISLEEVADTCTLFAPSNPKTKARLTEINEFESKFDLQKLIVEAVENCQTIGIGG
jgi:thiamine biosynthesis protein ThiI